MNEPRELWVVTVGDRPYPDVLEMQRELARARMTGDLAQDVLLLAEHPPVVTLGRSAKEQHLVVPRSLLAERGIDVHEIERGGDVTFHGPGQLVGYPIVDLRRHRQDLHWYLRQLEEVLIRACAAYGIVGNRASRYTGVWVGHRKLASIGVHARDWVTWHGFALNVSTKLSFFDLIVPCGIEAVEMTSIERELGGRAPSVTAVGEAVASAFGDVFALAPQLVGDADVHPVPGSAAQSRG